MKIISGGLIPETTNDIKYFSINGNVRTCIIDDNASHFIQFRKSAVTTSIYVEAQPITYLDTNKEINFILKIKLLFQNNMEISYTIKLPFQTFGLFKDGFAVIDYHKNLVFTFAISPESIEKSKQVIITQLNIYESFRELLDLKKINPEMRICVEGEVRFEGSPFFKWMHEAGVI